MPTVITPYALLVWLGVGFFTGLGWTLAAWLVGLAFYPITNHPGGTPA